MVHIRSTLFFIGYSISTISYGTLSLFLWVLPPRVRHRVIITWTQFSIAWLKLSCGIKYNVEGLEYLDQLDGPAVILSKHQSTWETIFLQSLFWPSSTVLKKELLKIPFFGWGLAALEPIAINRDNPKKALKQVKQKGIDRLNEGLNIILFPEGTRMLPGEKGNYARSGADIAVSANVKIIPIAVNAGVYWPTKSFLKFPGEIQVQIGKPIDTTDRNSKELIREVEEWIEDRMAKLPTKVSAT